MKLEVVLLRKKVQESNMNHSSSILNQIIESQRSVNDKSGLVYKAVVINECSSLGVKETGTEKKNEKGADKNSLVEKQEEKNQDQLFREGHMIVIRIRLMAIVFFVTIMDTRLHCVISFQERYLNIMVMRSPDMDMKKGQI